jgi:hypothetical protein
MQEDFNFGAPLTGNSCPETSYEAADKMSRSVKTVRGVVYNYIKKFEEFGATAYEIDLHFKLGKNTTSPRITELKLAGKVFDSGRRRKNDHNNNVVVWVSDLKHANK